jgi:hypothetical protein
MGYTKTAWVSSTAPGIGQNNLNNLEMQYDQAITIGEIRWWTTSTAPTNYLLCDGSSYSNASTYAALFAVTSYRFGGSNSTFQVPNLKGKFVAGYSGAGDYATVGLTGGTSETVLSQSQIPELVHSVYFSYYISGSVVYGYEIYSGTGSAHENRPPYIVLTPIIRYQ